MKVTIKGFITYERARYQGDEEYGFQCYEPSIKYSPEKVVVRAHEIEVDVPDNFDPRPQMVASLDQQINDVRAEFSARITELQRERAKLLSIENSAS